MAVVFAKLVSSDNILKYTVTSGGAENANIDAAGAATPDLATDSTGALHDLLTASVASQAAGRTRAFGRTDLLISLVNRDGGVIWTLDANTDGASHLRLNMAASGAAAVGAILTIEHRHSLVR